MGTPRHILVGTDFSDASNAALEAARAYAKVCDAKLTLLHAYSATLDALGPSESREQRMQIGRGIHDALTKLKDQSTGLVAVHTEMVETDDAVTALCDYASTHGVDLIVVGSHGRAGVKRLMLGSVAESVVRRATCSVLIARA